MRSWNRKQKRGIRSLAEGNGNCAEVAQTTEWGKKIGKGIKAESMEKVWEQKHKRRGRANKMDIVEGG